MSTIDELENSASVDAEFLHRTGNRFLADTDVRFGMVKFADGSVREVAIDPDSRLARQGLLVPGSRFRANLVFSGIIPAGMPRDYSIKNIRLLSDPQPKVEPLRGFARVEQLWKGTDFFVPGQAVKGRIQEYLCQGDIMGEPRVTLAAVTLASRALLGRTRYSDVRVAFVQGDAGLCLPREGSSFSAKIGRSEFAGEPPYRPEGTIFELNEMVVHPEATFAPPREKRDHRQAKLKYALGG